MYGKIFAQIFDSSIADNYQARHLFMDLIVLAEIDGVVDMTLEAIAARTRIPLSTVRDGMSILSRPDPKSRTKEEDGRRIVRIDPNRDWGWKIVNYEAYRFMRDGDERRAYMRNYMRERRAPVNSVNSVNSCKPLLTDVNPRKPMQKQRKKNSTDTEGASRYIRPTLEEVRLIGAKAGLPDFECQKLFNYYESVGWKVGKQPMKSLPGAVAGWKLRWEERSGIQGPQKQKQLSRQEIDALLDTVGPA